MMRRLFAITLLCLLAGIHHASGESSSSLPSKFAIPWGNSAGSSYIRTIPQASQIGIQNCAASLTDGFPPLTFVSSAQGGCPPFGQDFNGILKQLSQWSRWNGMGTPVFYDSAFSSGISGYPEWATLAVVATPGCFWVSTVNNNASDPDTGGANWVNTCTYVFGQNETVTGVWSFNTGSFKLNGSSTGSMFVNAPATAGGTTTLETGTMAALDQQDQTLSGGANVTSYAVPQGSYTVDCGKRSLQYIAGSNTAWTINAPQNDSSCMLQIVNQATGTPVIPSFSGFTTNSNTGEPITTANNGIFVLTIWRINGVSSYLVKALQ
jgi:hypothetical protein